VHLLLYLNSFSNVSYGHKLSIAVADSLLLVLIIVSLVALYKYGFFDRKEQDFNHHMQDSFKILMYLMIFPITSFAITMITLFSTPDASTEINILGMFFSTAAFILAVSFLFYQFYRIRKNDKKEIELT
jgi:tellurite resistance protein TehA-like permease